jgi:hypothetical protein
MSKKHHLEKELEFIEQLFVLEYVECRSYKIAGERVGLSKDQVHLLTKRKAFHEEVERLTGTVLGRAEVTAQRIVDELASIGFVGDMSQYRDPDSGMLIPEMIPKHGDRIRALELLGKWSKIKLFTEVTETNTKDEEARAKTRELEERIELMKKDRMASMGGQE